ncbi:DUF3043 domain-containing protein [Gordonia rubripertincta]|uniref:DUF3043 domain-containing protein n=2 Tax=Gordonia rubripertincta TaxID=36822 RepID=A0AAW4G522_GORRU|nr:DUF3043 domain-containing protein [Gordonia rubripertincta]MBM7278218.1 DUF3043 domain-containing protein [Gordonia rubripertincta]MDG6779627.1 DUF3043 domain-containing protein [Gordonia rubripertincta]NKY62934.1 DUF3043 domain-containing protein [Gordonia rubripertincta]QMU19159.1 DUF3043 domain-containing protein [Gordonia rubripertincta]GAB87205.1 hypothetical protein GORBP_097_00380 [Gordonia rubripertincta NBRC 101908]
MKLPWKKDETSEESGESTVTTYAADDAATEDSAPAKGSKTTPGKGRPTPKRREAEKRRGPVAPPPTTRSEARARKKELKNTLSKDEKKQLAAERRAKRLEQRERMMEGDEAYLMPRDKGPVRRYTRDIVDARRNFAGLFMPFAILLIVLMFMVPQAAGLTNLILVAFVVLMAVDGFILGRLVNRRVAERYPDSQDGGFKLGWYAFTRAMQLRKMRAPKPSVSRGDEV